MWFFLLLACVGDEADSGEDDAPLPTLDPLLDGLSRCEPGAADGRLDLDAGCAEGVCMGMSAEEVAGALGTPTCVDLAFDAVCTHGGGITVAYADDDGDALPDEGAHAYVLALTAPWDGGTSGGLACDATMRCFPEQLGTPDVVAWQRTEAWQPSAMVWNAWFLTVEDRGDAEGGGEADGHPETLTLANALYR